MGFEICRPTSNQRQVTFTIHTDAGGDFRAQLIPISRSGSAPSPDFAGNGRVGFSDFVAFAGAYGAREGQADFNPKFDLDGDGRVGFSDFVMFANAYGKPVGG